MRHTGLFILLRTRLLLARNSLLLAGGRDGGRMIALGLLGALFVFGAYWFFYRILAYFNGLPLNVGEILIIQLLNLLCLTLFSMLVFSNIIASISTLYMSRDLDILISSPISIRDVFISKFAHTMVNSSWMPVMLGIPIFVAYGRIYHAPWMYYAVMPLILAPFLVVPSGLGIMVTVALMRFFPARRVSQVMAFVGLVFVAALVMFFRFLKPEKFLGEDVPEDLIIEFVDKLKAPDYPWLPSSMMARALQAGATGDWRVFTAEAGWLWIAGLFCAITATAVASRLYYKGWASGSGARASAAVGKERWLYRLSRGALSAFAPDMRALMMKDIKLFWRDTGQWSQLFMLGALVVVYVFNIRNLPLDTFYLRNVVSVMNIGLAGIVLAAVSARFVFATTSMEGRSFWTIHVAPVDFGRFLWAKLLLYLFPLLILAETLVVVSNVLLGVDRFVMAMSACAIASITIGLAGLGVGMGAMYPRFDFENVAEIGTTTGAIMYMIISLGYVGLCVSLVAGPVHTHLRGVFTRAQAGWIDTIVSLAALGLVTAAFVFVPIRMGARALRMVET